MANAISRNLGALPVLINLIHKSQSTSPIYPVHYFITEICAHFCYKKVHCGTFILCIVGFVRFVIYYNFDTGTMWHWAFVSCSPSQTVRLFFWCALSWRWVSLCVPFTNSLIEGYFIMVVATIVGMLCPFYLLWPTHLGFLKLGSSDYATTHLPGCFCPWTFFLNIGLDMLHLRIPLCLV